MSYRIRWFQFSLRGLLAALTGLGIWLGVVVNSAREQRDAVMAIEALGGKVRYDWHELGRSMEGRPRRFDNQVKGRVNGAAALANQIARTALFIPIERPSLFLKKSNRRT